MKHNIVRRLIKRGGCRREYHILLNDRLLEGLVVRTVRKGVEVMETHYKGEMIPFYDPLWLARKNGRHNINIPMDHPAMQHRMEDWLDAA